MKNLVLAIVALGFLAACGGSRGYNPGGSRGGGEVLYATGPVQKACQSQGRKKASRARCGCIQAVADRSLSGGDQRRGAKFFKEPEKAQEVRQSDRDGDERFWREWKEFGSKAATLCASS
ncbi:hypothetical protein C1J03_19820 [Sulfitobacter sp. SK012]|uniref:hypothetical protein n=1 Tax=Sulfitobacter sp. SK012 TaxID=1389005 RepID=UPI000E0C871C|nr:hypothetical protein [Sulfitobacter sp. SK012]AXI48051.1 hypothetical protein C1J03_19820 [Sulfitobacter sp. SK012]